METCFSWGFVMFRWVVFWIGSIFLLWVSMEMGFSYYRSSRRMLLSRGLDRLGFGVGGFGGLLVGLVLFGGGF